VLPIDVARNLLVEMFLQTDADYMWFLDQDAAFLPQTLERLMSWDLPIVGALEMMRMPEQCYPMALKEQRADGTFRVQASEVYGFIGQHYDYVSNQPQILNPAPPGCLLETRWTGCHCLLIHRDVLEQMEPPWFQGYDPGGEDQYFCEKAHDDLGFTTYVDMSVLAGHASTDRIIGAFDFMAHFWFMAELEKHKENGGNDESPERRREPGTDAETVYRVAEGVTGHRPDGGG
jgi:hypothetical protein